MNPVPEWVRGTTLRPILELLPDGLQIDFMAEYAEQLREEYPEQDGKTVFPFRRTFVVTWRKES